MDFFADPDTAQSSLIQNLASLPAVVRNYNDNQGAAAGGAPETTD